MAAADAVPELTGDRNIKNHISASIRGVLPHPLGVHVRATLQQKFAGIDIAVHSGVVKGCCAAADAVKEERENDIKRRISASFRELLHFALVVHTCAILKQNVADINGAVISGPVKGCLVGVLPVSLAGARWVRREMIGHEREVAATSCFKNGGLACDAGGGSSLHTRGDLQQTNVHDGAVANHIRRRNAVRIGTFLSSAVDASMARIL